MWILPIANGEYLYVYGENLIKIELERILHEWTKKSLSQGRNLIVA